MLKVFTGLDNFTPWSGAVDTYNRISDEDKLDELDFILEDLYPDGIDETHLNDILWFDSDWIYELLNITDEDGSEYISLDDLQDAAEAITT